MQDATSNLSAAISTSTRPLAVLLDKLLQYINLHHSRFFCSIKRTLVLLLHSINKKLVNLHNYILLLFRSIREQLINKKTNSWNQITKECQLKKTTNVLYSLTLRKKLLLAARIGELIFIFLTLRGRILVIKMSVGNFSSVPVAVSSRFL